MAACYEVLYGTDPNLYDQVFEAAAIIDRRSKSFHLLDSLPDYGARKNRGRENRRSVDNRFLLATIQANSDIAEIMEMEDPRVRLPHLKAAYQNLPVHVPTLVALVLTEWELGHDAIGDRILLYLRRLEVIDFLWPVQILEATRIRRISGIDKAREFLKNHKKLQKMQSNPAKKLKAMWQKEIQDAGGDRVKLLGLGVFENPDKALHSQENQEANSQNTYRIKLQKGELSEEEKHRYRQTVESRLKSQSDRAELLDIWFKLKPRSQSVKDHKLFNKKLLEYTNQLLKTHPDRPQLWYYLSFGFLRDPETMIAYLEKALTLDPTYQPALKKLASNNKWLKCRPDPRPFWKRAIADGTRPEIALEYLNWLRRFANRYFYEELPHFIDHHPVDRQIFSLAANDLVARKKAELRDIKKKWPSNSFNWASRMHKSLILKAAGKR